MPMGPSVGGFVTLPEQSFSAIPLSLISCARNLMMAAKVQNARSELAECAP
jgi:hypothetical protein